MLGILQAIFTLPELVKPELPEIQNLSNCLIACAYYSIFFTLLYFIRQRQDFSDRRIFLLFATLCITCGTNHLIEVSAFWPFTPWLKTWMGASAALVLVLTSINLSLLIPKALTFPSPAQLEATEKALQESEQLLANLTKLAPVGIFRNDIQGNCIYGNDRCFEMVGISPAELMGSGWTKNLHPEDFDRVIATWFNFVERGIPYYIEHRFQHADGKVVWVLGEAIAQKDADGNIIGYIGTITDITERKQAEKVLANYNRTLELQVQERTAQLQREIVDRQQIEIKLRHSQAKLSTLLNNVGAYIYIKDLNSNYIYVNRLTVELFGGNEAEIIGANDFKFFSPETALSFREKDKKAMESGTIHHGDEVAINSKGELRYYFYTKVPLKTEDGIVYGICGISTDITELKQAEEALRQSEQRMQAILSAMPDLIFRQRVDGTYLDVMGNTSGLIVPREALIGNNLKDTLFPEQLKANLLERFQAAVETGQLQIYEHDLQKPEGRHSYESRIIKSGADEVVCIVRDITEKKRFTAALQESEKRYRSVVTAMAEGIVFQDANGVIRTCNASAKKILGLSRQQMMGRTSIDPNWQAIQEDGSPFPGEQHPAMVTLKTGKPCANVVMGVKKPDGSLTWISINSQPLFRASKTLPYAVVVSFSDITDRKQAENALRESEARFQAFMDNSPAAAWITDEWGKILYLNQTYSRIFKLPSNYSVGKTEMDIYPADPRSEYLKNIRQVVETNQALEAIEPAPRPDGSIGEFLVYKFPLPSASGQVLVGGVAIDITERKQAEEAMRASQHFLQKIANATPHILYLFDVKETKTLYLNQQSKTVLGYSPDEICNADFQWFINCFHPDDRHLCYEIPDRFVNLSDREILSTEYRFKHKNGKWLWLNTREVVFARDNNGIPSQILGAVEDITQRKQMEQALQESNERFQLAASAVKGIIYDWDLKQNTSKRSQGLFDMMGYLPEEIDPNGNWWIDRIHPEDLPNVSQQLSSAFATQNHYVLEYRIRHRDGRYIYLSDYGVIVRDASGQAVRAVGNAIDVSNARQAELALQTALVAAEAASVAKSRFLSNMSHELRTPLNAILGFSQMMARSNSLSDEQKEQLKIINRSGEYLLNLINDILSMSKIEAGQVTLNETSFDLYQLLDDLEKMFQLKAFSSRLQLIFERTPDTPQYIQTDESKLRQVLINLLGNAIKFTEAGSVRLRVKTKAVLSDRQNKCDRDITVENSPPTRCLIFEIEDTGPGIAPGEMDTLFDPFVQTETGRRAMQGTGLGLPISQQFVRLMGGEIAVSSQLGKGTTFTFNIVIKHTSHPDEKTSSNSRRAIGLAPEQPEYRILVVEDVEESRLLLVKLLETVGFQVRSAANGIEAVKLWSSWKPHLIWMDMRMPFMDGYQATRQIKAMENLQETGDWRLASIRDKLRKQSIFLEETENSSEFSAISSQLKPMPSEQVTPTNYNSSERSPSTKTIIIALTASAFEQDRANIMATGCDDFIRKPFQESVLLDKMAQYLGVRYVYEQDLPPTSSQPVIPLKLAREDLRVMPMEWIGRVNQAVLCADEKQILQLIEEIPDSEASLATAIADLVNNFRLDVLLDLTEAFTNE